ncbi:hypothetical protein QR680_001158 [Steinernema hermaphroditum]|uniref:MKRN2 opposite strand protein-like C-terminal domain-containing protein n=1 Tax=Steinernema hermaphroditum TaxID=289476 RepID=A0AA39LFI6_9BILA|nr:hypothetical protein QR680_001158 [Steinernema hermaphroditum]
MHNDGRCLLCMCPIRGALGVLWPWCHYQNPCVVIKPTFGSFLSYKTGQNLHIGIADSHSVVHSFSGSGVLSESSTWDMSLVVCRFDVASMDEMMRLFMSDHAHYFSKDSYRETDWNCFDFVIHFLSFAKLGRYSKAVFTQLFVLDIMKCARRYAKLFKRVMRRGPLTMAECLEADHSNEVDNDRRMDSCSFQRDQFDIFKHDFRENAEKLGENSTPLSLDTKTKKEIVNVVRSLQKAQFFVDSQSPNGSLKELSLKLESTSAQLKAFLVGKGSLDGEFTAQNVALPDYVHSDLSLLMGSEDTGLPVEPGPLDSITALDRVTKAKIDELLGASSILLLEYDDLKRVLKSKAIA